MLTLLLLACGPERPTLTLTPPNPTTRDTLIAETEPVDNGFGDPLQLRYLWLLDGEEQPDQSTEQLNPAFTTRGQEWEVQVWATEEDRDGRVASEVVVIQNAPPLIAIAAAEVQSSDAPLSVLTTVTDPDGDEVVWTLSWARDGEPTDFTDEVIDADQTAPGQEWTATVDADDGQDSSSGRVVIAID